MKLFFARNNQREGRTWLLNCVSVWLKMSQKWKKNLSHIVSTWKLSEDPYICWWNTAKY